MLTRVVSNPHNTR